MIDQATCTSTILGPVKVLSIHQWPWSQTRCISLISRRWVSIWNSGT